MPDSLDRFLSAQQEWYSTALGELRAGRKHTHWMWFIFPQLRGLGMSETSRHYGIAGLGEASAYLQNPVLGPRLLECTSAVMQISGKSLSDVFDAPDDTKFISCMTLFSLVAPPDMTQFRDALARYHRGQPDDATLRLLRGPVGR
jgi:uncharacterized protein (DUF1810 family)